MNTLPTYTTTTANPLSTSTASQHNRHPTPDVPLIQPPTRCPLPPILHHLPRNRANPSRSRPTAGRKPGSNGPHDPTNRPELSASRPAQPGKPPPPPHSDSYCRSYCPPRTEHPSPLKHHHRIHSVIPPCSYRTPPPPPPVLYCLLFPIHALNNKKPATSLPPPAPSRTIQNRRYNSRAGHHTPPSPREKKKKEGKGIHSREESACRLRHKKKTPILYPAPKLQSKGGAIPSRPPIHDSQPHLHFQPKQETKRTDE